MHRYFPRNIPRRGIGYLDSCMDIYERVPFGDIGMIIVMVLSFILIVAVVVLIVKILKTKKKEKGSLSIDILNMKLVNDEISEEDYIKLKKHILNS